ncbi:uncharacterized protein LOC135388639 isoform X2 [Ornithodoros turicata]|uniref:uncharacterized protein LOC135388639 isoform X2 n=1 Tax=Ornithodoros turicata TaxID=34597 RepID=UPI0031399162
MRTSYRVKTSKAYGKGDISSLTAVFNTGGLRGSIEFSQVAINQGVNIHVSLVGGQPKEVFRWAVYNLPTRYDTANPCAVPWIGTMITDLSDTVGLLASEEELQMFAPDLHLFDGPDAIVGRTLVLRGIQTGRMACAAVSPQVPPNTYVAYFHGVVAGHMYVRQSGSYSTVYSQLYWINGTRKDTLVNWRLLRDDMKFPSTDAERETGPQNGSPPAIYSGREPLSAGKAPNLESAYSYNILTRLPAMDSITQPLRVSLQHSRTGATLSSARLKPLAPKHATGNMGAPFGEAVFHQTSPFEQTLAIIKFDNLRNGATNFRVSRISLSYRDTQCPPSGATFDPQRHDSLGVPPPTFGTPDQYALGDLSGKYGLLIGKDTAYYRILDPTLPLYGPNSIIGRALTVYRTDTIPLVCVNIIPVGKKLVTGQVILNKPISGNIILSQTANNPDDDTYISAELCWSEHSNSTVDHNWHIHEQGLQTVRPGHSTTHCQPAGGHYNPDRADKDGVYFSHCSKWAQFRCEAGDLSSRLETLSIPPCTHGMAKYHFVDSNVALSGPSSVLGRSIVIHSAHYGGTRVICGNIDTE